MANSYSFTLTLEFTSLKKLVIGAPGQIGPEADVMFVRAGDSLFIPGSAIKGMLRNNATIVAALLNHKVERSILPQRVEKSNDIVAQVFGKPGSKGSKVFVLGTRLKESRTSIITHVSIDENTRTASEGALYNVEYLPPGTVFESEIECRSLSLEQAELFFASLAASRYSRFGRDGMIDVAIIKRTSSVPADLLSSSKIISEVWSVLSR